MQPHYYELQVELCDGRSVGRHGETQEDHSFSADDTNLWLYVMDELTLPTWTPAPFFR